MLSSSSALLIVELTDTIMPFSLFRIQSVFPSDTSCTHYIYAEIRLEVLTHWPGIYNALSFIHDMSFNFCRHAQQRQEVPTSPTGMPHGPHLGPKWAAKWVPLGQPKWDPLRFVRGAHMGPKWICPCVIQVGPNWDPRTIFQLQPTSLPSGSHVSI